MDVIISPQLASVRGENLLHRWEATKYKYFLTVLKFIFQVSVLYLNITNIERIFLLFHIVLSLLVHSLITNSGPHFPGK